MFQPVVPAPGLIGWRFVQRTLADQLNSHSNLSQNKRDTDHFRDQISNVKSSSDLVTDGKLLRVALGAFGLQADVRNIAFIKKIIDDGTERPGALANRLADSRYREFARSFAISEGAAISFQDLEFTNNIIEKFNRSEYEVAIGSQREDIRLALNAERELVNISSKDATERTKWYQILGAPPLRRVFEEALSLPTSFGQIDIEDQVEVMSDLLSRRLNIRNLDSFKDLENINLLVDRYIINNQVNLATKNNSTQSIALTLLQSVDTWNDNRSK